MSSTTFDLFDNSKLNLDMSFNRHPEGTFACDVDPLSQEPFGPSPPTPTFESFEPSEEELYDALLTWKFPIRTDYARGLIWGPYKHCRGNSWSSDAAADSSDITCLQPHPTLPLFIEPSNQQEYSCNRLLDIPVTLEPSPEILSTQSPVQEVSEVSPSPPTPPQEQPLPPSQPVLPARLQRIFPILRSPIVIRIKPLSVSSTTTTTTTAATHAPNPSKRRRQSSRTDSFKSTLVSPRVLHFGLQPHQQKKQKFVQVAFSVQPMNPSRIKLCASSRLKYAN